MFFVRLFQFICTCRESNMFGVSMLKGDISKTGIFLNICFWIFNLSLKYFLDLVEQFAVMDLRWMQKLECVKVSVQNLYLTTFKFKYECDQIFKTLCFKLNSNHLFLHDIIEVVGVYIYIHTRSSRKSEKNTVIKVH